jgi:hypothetical protein
MNSTDQQLSGTGLHNPTNKGHRLPPIKEIVLIVAMMACAVTSSYIAYKLMFDENVMCHFNQGTTKAQPALTSPKP